MLRSLAFFRLVVGILDVAEFLDFFGEFGGIFERTFSTSDFPASAKGDALEKFPPAVIASCDKTRAANSMGVSADELKSLSRYLDCYKSENAKI